MKLPRSTISSAKQYSFLCIFLSRNKYHASSFTNVETVEKKN